MTKQRKLTAQESNRLALQLQVLKIKMIEFALRYTFNGKSELWGQEVDQFTLSREKAKLSELCRLKEIYESKDYRKLPYYPSNSGLVRKIKEHYQSNDGLIAFIEVKEVSHGQSVTNFLSSKKVIKRRINKKQQSLNRNLKAMATKRKTAAKATDTEDLLGFIDVAAIDDVLDGINENVPAYKTSDKISFVHAGGKVKGSVLKVLEGGKLKAVDAAGTVYNITVNDILKEGETAAELIARNKKGAKKEEKASKVEDDLLDEEIDDLLGTDEDNLLEGIEEEDLPLKKAAKTKALPAKKTPVKPGKGKTPAKPAAPAKQAKNAPVKAKSGGKTQRELVEELAERGERDYDVIAKKTGVTRINVGQYMYRWKKANPKKW